LGTNLWASEKLLKEAGEYVQGAVLPAGFYSASSSPRVQQFMTTFESVYGRAPGFIEAIAYDSASIMLRIMLDPDVWLRAGIRHALLQATPAEGVTGSVAFNGNGEPTKELVLLQIDGNGFVEIDPSQRPVDKAGPVPPPPAPPY